MIAATKMSIYREWIAFDPSDASPTLLDDHWKEFEAKRKKYNDNIFSETNKLVLRLDKFINSDEGHGSQMDRSLVEWTSDSLVKLCPFCAKSFTIARRRHHCRVCGAILCSNCSKFLEYEAACKLVRPARLYTDVYDRIEDKLEKMSTEDKPRIRTCEDCMRLLEKRVQTIEDHYSQPEFYDLYQELRKRMREADELILAHESLISESKKPAAELKGKIHDLKQKIVTISSKLSKIPQSHSGRQAHLLHSINQSVAFWLKESVENKSRRTVGGPMAGPSGWVPEQVSSPDISAEENPLLIQIKNLDEYIKQAKLASRYQEVSLLEESKRDLETEYLNQLDQSRLEEGESSTIKNGEIH